MSLFGSLMGDFEDDPFFGMHMRSMRQMNNMMNSLFSDPFGMMEDYGSPALTAANRAASHNSLMPFGFPPMPNINRLLSGSLDNLGGHNLAAHNLAGHNLVGHNLGGHNLGGHSYSSTSVVSMTSGPDGRPQVYRASASTRTAPGGVRETQRTVCDSRTGTKKMAIGHHIGDRAHVIEREHNLHSGDQEEREDFINIEEDEAEDFNREWEVKAPARNPDLGRLTGGPRVRHSPHRALPAITAGPQSRRNRSRSNTPLVSPRRSIRAAPLALSSSSNSSSSRRPYSPPGTTGHPRKHRNVKSVSGSGSPDL